MDGNGSVAFGSKIAWRNMDYENDAHAAGVESSPVWGSIRVKKPDTHQADQLDVVVGRMVQGF